MRQKIEDRPGEVADAPQVDYSSESTGQTTSRAKKIEDRR